MDMTFLQKNYLLVALSVILSLIVTSITNLILSQEDESKSYIKSAIVAALVSGVAVYIHSMSPELEKILTEPPPF